MALHDYRDLIIWQKAMNVAEMSYKITKKLPKEEIYALTNQMRRAAVSIPSNIAEGHARYSTKEYMRFLRIAQGSKAELETQLLLCVKIGYLEESDISETMDLLVEIGKMLARLISKLRSRLPNP